MKVCIGGTFNILHNGHKALIDRAFEASGKDGAVFIGLTRGELLKNKTKTRSFAERKKVLKEYLIKKNYIKKAIIKPITNRYGTTIDVDFDAIVVSPETLKTAEEINNMRLEKGKKPLKIIKVHFVLSADGKTISSTRIARGEIDENGNICQRD